MIVLFMAFLDAPPREAPLAVLDIRFDLAHPPVPSPSPEDIIVTGRRANRRLPPLPDLRENLLPLVQTGLLGGTVAAVIESSPLLGGATSNRIMLRWKKTF